MVQIVTVAPMVPQNHAFHEGSNLGARTTRPTHIKSCCLDAMLQRTDLVERQMTPESGGVETYCKSILKTVRKEISAADDALAHTVSYRMRDDSSGRGRNHVRAQPNMEEG